jgi:V8-like Glu-specific endopeptidase
VKPLIRVGVVAVVGVASALTGTSAVHAQESGATRAPASTAVSSVVSTSAASTVAEQNRITRYWTSARMKAARAGEALAPKRSLTAGQAAEAAGRPTAVAATAAKGMVAALSTGDPYTGAGAVVKTTGKVFFTLGGSDYVCSGSAVTSTNKDTVLTAGHCVHEGPGSFATNWAFVPGYNNGNRPYGTFTARRLLTTSAWSRRGDFNYDVGFALMNQVSGKDLTDTVGGQGIAFNQSRGKYMYAFGYPAASPYDGSDLIHCDGTVFQDTYGNSTDQGMDCDMTGGSSGGPWFYNFNTSTGTGTLNSVNSFGYTGLDDVMWGPYFGNTISSLYTTAKSG